MDFDPEVALNYARSIARPRKVGSGEEVVVANELVDRLTRFGWQVERQPFEFSTASNVVLSLGIALDLLSIAAILLLRDRLPIATAVCAVLILFSIVLAGPISRSISIHAVRVVGQPMSKLATTVLKRVGTHYAATNLIATLPDNVDSTLPHLYLMAHYDSKSQYMPLVIRIGLFVIAVPSSLLVAVLALLNLSMPVTSVLGVIALLAGLPLLFLDFGNDSPGAIDNASGVGLVLHLAECLSQRSDWRDRLRVSVVFTSAEELGLMGTVAFVRAEEERLRRESQAGLYILNFDGIGVDGELQWVGAASARLADLIVQSSQDLYICTRRFRLIGALFDHVPLARHGFDAVSLITVGRASRSVHRPADAVGKLHVRGFDQGGRVTLKLIEKLSSLSGGKAGR
jgi:Peptidase family M28